MSPRQTHFPALVSSFILAQFMTLSLATSASSDTISQRTENNGNVQLEGIPPVPQTIVDELNRYQNIRGASLQGWQSRSGIYIRTRFADTSQIHRVDMPGGARYQLTFFDEPVGAITVSPERRRLAFLMDSGGNEASQVFIFDPQTRRHRLITDGQSRNRAVLWFPDAQRIAHQSTQRNGRSNDIWLTPIHPSDSAQLILPAPDGSWWGPVDVTQDGKQLIVQQYVSVTDSRIHLVDVAGETRRRLCGGNNDPSRNLVSQKSAFTKTEDGIFFVTDQTSDFAKLAFRPLSPDAQISPDTQIEIITSTIPWDVEDFTLSDDRTIGAFVVNQNGLSQLYLLDPQSRNFAPVDNLPVGLVGSLYFSPDGTQLGLTLNTPRTPSDVFVLQLGETPLEYGELTRWTSSEVGGLDTESFVVPEMIHYPTFDKVDGKTREIPAFVYRPRRDSQRPSTPAPVIISIHGGPESQYRPAFNSTYQLWIEKLGAAVIAPNVRGSAGYGKHYVTLDNGFRREDSVKDIGALLDWIATQPDLDARRVAVYGGSYGGYMVLSSCMHYSDRLRAAVDVVGISNFVTFLKNTQDYRRDLRRVEYGDERDESMRQFLQSISPTNNVDRIQVPMLVVQGQNDPRVPVTEAEQIVAALRNQGNEVWYMNALNEGHGYRKKENRDLFGQVVMMFLQEHLLEPDRGTDNEPLAN